MIAYLPPSVVNVRVRKHDAKGFRIWLPLFLLWPLLLALLLLVLFCTAVADLVLLLVGARYHHYTVLVIGALQLLGSARGTHVRATNDDSLVNVDIYGED
jgi:hypothetical protein